MRISAVFSTYNEPTWLEKAIWGYSVQDYDEFDLVIADDGSRDDTRQTIHRLRNETGLEIRHVWHEDAGFQKCRILNKATVEAPSEYLVFSDGDCIPRRDFLSTHARLARPGRFLSGGTFRLSHAVSQAVTKQDILSGRVFDPSWLRSMGQPWNRRFLKLAAGPPWFNVLDRLTTTNASWNGHNASGFKSDILAVNGFNEDMGWGGEDRELGDRLRNAGLRPLQVRNRAICVHLEHERGYVDAEVYKRNQAVRRDTRRNRRTWTEHGITPGPPAG